MQVEGEEAWSVSQLLSERNRTLQLVGKQRQEWNRQQNFSLQFANPGGVDEVSLDTSCRRPGVFLWMARIDAQHVPLRCATHDATLEDAELEAEGLQVVSFSFRCTGKCFKPYESAGRHLALALAVYDGQRCAWNWVQGRFRCMGRPLKRAEDEGRGESDDQLRIRALEQIVLTLKQEARDDKLRIQALVERATELQEDATRLRTLVAVLTRADARVPLPRFVPRPGDGPVPLRRDDDEAVVVEENEETEEEEETTQVFAAAVEVIEID